MTNVWQACSVISNFAHPKKNCRQPDFTGIHMDMSDDEEESSNWLAYHPLVSELIHSMYAELFIAKN